MDTGSSTDENVCYVTCNEPRWRFCGAVKRNVETNEEYAAFYDVPYAKRPVGTPEERYQAPKPAEAHKLARLSSSGQQSFFVDEYDAKKPTRMYCAQVVNNDLVQGSADCLHMNIFLPSRIERIGELLPVLVFFHGGGFTNGDNNHTTYTPDSIIQHGVIFITVSYRIGLYGFFNMHTKECPGNAGLKDQVRALEWIRDNIENFKGDPKNITISGSQSGATCVNLHLVAPMSRDLFHKAIVQSGGVYCPWGYKGRGRAMKNIVASDWECKRLFYADQGEQRLHERVQQLLHVDRQIRHPFTLSPFYGPTTETIKEGAFISEKIDEMMTAEVNPKIAILAGITQNEGINVFAIDTGGNFQKVILERNRFLRFLADNFHWTPDTAIKCVDEIRRKYLLHLEHRLSNDEKKYVLSKVFHDISFRRFYDNFKFGPKRTLHKNLFVYQFDHFSQLSLAKRAGLHNVFPFPGFAAHADELQYLYRAQTYREKYRSAIEEGVFQNPEIKLVTSHMCSLWANFCKTGTPSSDFAPHVVWRPHTEEKPCYLRISKDLILEEGPLCKEAWDELNTLVNREPVVQSRPPTPE